MRRAPGPGGAAGCCPLGPEDGRRRAPHGSPGTSRGGRRTQGGRRCGEPPGGGRPGDGGGTRPGSAGGPRGAARVRGAPSRRADRRRRGTGGQRREPGGAALAARGRESKRGWRLSGRAGRDPGQPGPPISAEELFDRGMESFRAGELGQAVLDFEEFADKYSGHPLAPSVQFWIGEAYFRSRDFEQATSKYQRAIDLAPTRRANPGRSAPPWARSALAPSRGSGARGMGPAPARLSRQRRRPPRTRRAPPAGPLGPASRAAIVGDQAQLSVKPGEFFHLAAALDRPFS